MALDRIKVEKGEGHFLSMPLRDDSQASIREALTWLGAEDHSYYELYDSAKGPKDSPVQHSQKYLLRPTGTTKPSWSA